MTERLVLTAFVETGTRPEAVAPGTGLLQLRFFTNPLEVPTESDSLSFSTFIVHLLRDLVPAEAPQIDDVVARGDVAARPEAAGPVLDQLRTVLAEPAEASHRLPFDVEPAWARTFGTVIAQITRVNPSTASVSRARRAQIERIVERFASDPRLTPVALASAIRVSRRTLYELTGTSLGGISEYIRVARVQAAVKLLADPAFDSIPMTQIATRSGFSSAKHLTRALNALFATSPSAVRRERTYPLPVRSDMT